MKKVTSEEFVRVWQTADSFSDVVKQLGLERDVIRNRAARYRKLGIPLRKFNDRLNGIDVSALTDLANSLRPKQ